MLDDSITASPQKHHRSIHKARLQRKNKRRCPEDKDEDQDLTTNETDTKPSSSSTIPERMPPSLANLYWEHTDNDSSTQLNATFRVHQPLYGADFDPFEDELLLAVADRLDCAQAQRSNQMDNVKMGKGFLKCSQLLQPEVVQILPTSATAPLADTSVTNAQITTLGTKTQFGITESELLHFCAEAEEVRMDVPKGVMPQPELEVLYTPQPQKHKSIVESILEDFCSSPVSPDLEHSKDNISIAAQPVENSTPVFRFKNSQMRTYSRHCSAPGRKRIARRLENVSVVAPTSLSDDENDNLSICSSDLSVQENRTQQPIVESSPVNSMVDLNISLNFRENLLNLSAYFSQPSSVKAAESKSSSQENYFSSVELDEVNDIDSFKPSVAAITRLTDQVITLRDKYKMFFRRDHCAAASDDFLGFSKAETEDVMPLLSCLALDTTQIEHVDKKSNVTCSEKMQRPGPSSNHGLPLSNKTQMSEDDIFSDGEEEWNDDCDFFKNFKTQDALCKANLTDIAASPTIPIKCQGFMSASRKPIAISAKAKQRAAQILADIDVELELQRQVPQVTTEHLNNLTAISSKEQAICEAAQKHTQPTQQELAAMPIRINNQGFQTASRKPIHISKQAQQRAQKILQEIDGNCSNLNETKSVESAAELGDIQLSEWLLEDKIEPVADSKNVQGSITAFTGFQTASKKHIKISEEAKLRAAKLLDNLPELPIKPYMVEEKKTNDVYQTNRIAASKLAHNSKASEASTFNLDKLAVEELKVMQLNDVAVREDDDIYVVPATTKRKLEHENVATSLQQSTKMLCKSYTTNSMHRTPLTTRTENALTNSKSFSALHENSPLAENANALLTINANLTSNKSTIISRKNLLSLSKRKKREFSQDPVMLDKAATAIDSTMTPLKTACAAKDMQAATATPNLKDFVDSLPNTSTPRLPKTAAASTSVVQINSYQNVHEIDMDFQEIKWDECNNTSSNSRTHMNSNVSSSKLNETSSSNVTLKDTNPSPKLRIERLRMYGKPPAVSPILMSSKNNCRPSGLRRSCRSMTKQ